MTVDLASLIVGAAIPLLGFLLTLAVAWGRFGQIIKDLVEALRALQSTVQRLDNRQTALEVWQEHTSERLERHEGQLDALR